MYFKLLNVHAIAMTSIVSNPLLYFWMSKRHRRALRDEMLWFTNVRRQQQMGLLEKFTPSPSLGILYRKSLERHLLNSTKLLSVSNSYRRGTLADPTCMQREQSTMQQMHANCFLLVPLMPLCVPGRAGEGAEGASTTHRLLRPNFSTRRCSPSSLTPSTTTCSSTRLGRSRTASIISTSGTGRKGAAPL
jgi:hypothetical protein